MNLVNNVDTSHNYPYLNSFLNNQSLLNNGNRSVSSMSGDLTTGIATANRHYPVPIIDNPATDESIYGSQDLLTCMTKYSLLRTSNWLPSNTMHIGFINANPYMLPKDLYMLGNLFDMLNHNLSASYFDSTYSYLYNYEPSSGVSLGPGNSSRGTNFDSTI